MHIYNLRWLAKLNFDPDVGFEFRELRQFGKFLTDLPGVKCAWVHPRHVDKEPVHLSYRVSQKKCSLERREHCLLRNIFSGTAGILTNFLISSVGFIKTQRSLPKIKKLH